MDVPSIPQTVASKRKDVFSRSEAKGMLECDWKAFISNVKKVSIQVSFFHLQTLILHQWIKWLHFDTDY